MAQETLYVMQASFTAGEVSPEVANRIDIDKYQSALLNAENCYIRPYGAVIRRGGTIYCGTAKYADKRCILRSFGTGYLLELGAGYVRAWKNGVLLENSECTTPYTEDELDKLRFAQSADVLFIASGTHPVMTLSRYSDTSWQLAEYAITKPYFDALLGGNLDPYGDVTLTPSGTTGNISITASRGFWDASMVGSYMKIQHEKPASTITMQGTAVTSISDEVLVGDQWKIITRGTWSGTVILEKYDEEAGVWEEYRTYKSYYDNNISESGTVETYTRLRLNVNILAKDNSVGGVDLTALPYTHEGIVRITAVGSYTVCSATVVESIGQAKATKDYQWGAWSNYFGWPQAVGFFQDRLCFAATQSQPYNLWMSRTGDYPNFSVEKASGTVTDDSAVALSFISRKQQAIKHIVAAADLLVLTEGNEWLVSGGETVTPTKGTPKVQTSRGCTDVIPISVGSRIVFVQRRGKVVRDMGYSFESDTYDGMDLTLLAKHLTSDTEIIDGTYMQDPDSIIYFVLKNGKIDCLSYVQDQKVYAWSHLVTDGAFESVCDVEEEDRDVVYAAVKRTIGGAVVRCIEKFMPVEDSDNPGDYIMMDCAGRIDTQQRSSAKAQWLAGETVGVLADGRYYKDIPVDEEGNFAIPAKASYMIVGLPYRTTIELPNVEISTQNGTVQGRNKKVSGASLRLLHTLGGRIGNGVGPMDEIKYDELSAQDVTLYSDDKEVTIPNPTVEKHGRVVIETEDPYPFNLAAIVREVTINA